jgi:hypothetical protein
MMSHVRIRGNIGAIRQGQHRSCQAKNRRKPLRPHGMNGSAPTPWLQRQTNCGCVRDSLMMGHVRVKGM